MLAETCGFASIAPLRGAICSRWIPHVELLVKMADSRPGMEFSADYPNVGLKAGLLGSDSPSRIVCCWRLGRMGPNRRRVVAARGWWVVGEDEVVEGRRADSLPSAGAARDRGARWCVALGAVYSGRAVLGSYCLQLAVSSQGGPIEAPQRLLFGIGTVSRASMVSTTAKNLPRG